MEPTIERGQPGEQGRAPSSIPLADKNVVNYFSFFPQREPFLMIDEVLDLSETTILTKKTFLESDEFFKGHFPGNPVVPAVLMQECAFQASALMLGHAGQAADSNQVAVVTRVKDAKFKRIVKPGTPIEIFVEKQETLANLVYCRAKLSVEGKTCATLQFGVALTDAQN